MLIAVFRHAAGQHRIDAQGPTGGLGIQRGGVGLPVGGGGGGRSGVGSRLAGGQAAADPADLHRAEAIDAIEFGGDDVGGDLAGIGVVGQILEGQDGDGRAGRQRPARLGEVTAVDPADAAPRQQQPRRQQCRAGPHVLAHLSGPRQPHLSSTFFNHEELTHRQ
ncbi:hypothetical protein TSH64_14835 [Azospirillum sp. TSH64]|nr:hypothetical protein TSH64_14835 [Azospirillum sp. TSH64]